MNDQDERHELLGRLETPPEFKDWASNTLPTPGISNGHQTMAEGRGTSEHETSHSYLSVHAVELWEESVRTRLTCQSVPLTSIDRWAVTAGDSGSSLALQGGVCVM